MKETKPNGYRDKDYILIDWSTCIIAIQKLIESPVTSI